jgi:hypothetical protein
MRSSSTYPEASRWLCGPGSIWIQLQVFLEVQNTVLSSLVSFMHVRIRIALFVLWPDISSHGSRQFELAWLPAREGLCAWFAGVHTYMCTRIHVVHDVLDTSCHGGPSFIPLCIDGLHAKLQLALQPAACGHVHE